MDNTKRQERLRLFIAAQGGEVRLDPSTLGELVQRHQLHFSVNGGKGSPVARLQGYLSKLVQDGVIACESREGVRFIWWALEPEATPAIAEPTPVVGTLPVVADLQGLVVVPRQQVGELAQAPTVDPPSPPAAVILEADSGHTTVEARNVARLQNALANFQELAEVAPSRQGRAYWRGWAARCQRELAEWEEALSRGATLLVSA